MFEMQFRNAYDAGFKGNFVVLHTSNPDTVDLGDSLVKALKPKFGLFYEVSFHHMFLNTDDYEVHGNRVKMNPSLTSPEMQERTLEYVLAGRYHMIGTDHAPHPVGKKDSDKPSSGIPVLPFWPRGLEILAREGMSIDRRDKLSFHNANEIYGLGLTPTEVNIEHQPRLWEAYGWNSFSRYD
jgi:dihydroorotase